MMKTLSSIIKLLLIVVPGFYSIAALANQEQCRAISQLVIQMHQEVRYLPDAADGSPITVEMPVDEQSVFTCSKNNPSDTSWNYKDVGYNIDADPSGLQGNIGNQSTPIYRIAGVEGVGFAIGFKEPTYCADEFHSTTGKGTRSSICNSTTNSQMAGATDLKMNPYVVFYKLPASSSPLNPGNQPTSVGELQIGSASLLVGDSASSSQPLSDSPKLFISSFTLRYGSCAVTSAEGTINVNMGKVSRSEFKGVGTLAGEQKTFHIQVICENNASVKVGFFGSTSSSDPDAFTPTKQNNAATGVGIALTYGDGLKVPSGQRVSLNKQSDALPVLKDITTAGQADELEFKAQYIQTDAQVTAGKADSMATFNLIYN